MRKHALTKRIFALGVTILLSLTVFLNLVAETLPQVRFVTVIAEKPTYCGIVTNGDFYDFSS